MTELDDEMERQLRAAQERVEAERGREWVRQRYGALKTVFPKEQLPPVVADFCSRLSRFGGDDCVAVIHEGEAYFGEIRPAGYFERRTWLPVFRMQDRNLRRDSIAARHLRIQLDEDTALDFYGLNGVWSLDADTSPWTLEYRPDRLRAALAGYLLHQ